jgi:hypothetical protein
MAGLELVLMNAGLALRTVSFPLQYRYLRFLLTSVTIRQCQQMFSLYWISAILLGHGYRLPFTYTRKKTSLARIQPKERIVFANRTSDIGEPTAGTAGCLIDKAVIVRPSLSFRTAAMHSAESCKFDGFDFS